MPAAKATSAAPAVRHWTVLVLDLPALAGDRRAARADRAALLRRIDEWLRAHRHPVALPAPDSDRRGTTVCVGFRREEAATALAWRHFCGTLGLSARLRQFRVHPNRCPRTSPDPDPGPD